MNSPLARWNTEYEPQIAQMTQMNTPRAYWNAECKPQMAQMNANYAR